MVNDVYVVLLMLYCGVDSNGVSLLQEPLEEKFPTATAQAMSFLQVSRTLCVSPLPLSPPPPPPPHHPSPFTPDFKSEKN